MRLDLSKITIAPDRQRRDLAGIPPLAESIARIGLINPIILTEANVLVAGERRLRAIQSLGWTSLAPTQYRYTNKMEWHELEAIELEENIKRRDITWQEQCNAVQRYHKVRGEVVGESWDIRACAAEIGLEYSYVCKLLSIAEEAAKNPEVLKANKASVAVGMVARAKERRVAAALESIGVEEPTPEPKKPGAAPKVPAAPAHPFLNTDFMDWAKTYKGIPFNFIHCDFPYGINFDKSVGMNKADPERYDDSPEYYKLLLTVGLPSLPISQEAHLMFWFSMNHYPLTLLTLKQMGWRVNEFPLIWAKSDNSGIIPDARRGPRRNYETAFIASRGDRPIVSPVSNIWYGARGPAEHTSSKPVAMLSHFFRMFIDGTSRVLDPTCGSGNAMKAAQAMGAKQVLGIERDPTFFADTVRRWSVPKEDNDVDVDL